MRSNLWRNVNAACAAVALFAAIVASQAAAKDLPPIKTVGVVSDMGDKVRLQHIGFTVFSNKLIVAEFPEWQIDAHVNGVIENALRERYEFRAVDFPKGQIAPELGRISLGGPSPEKNMRTHAKPANGEPIDAYLVVCPHRRIYPTNQQIESIGLLTQGKTARLYIAFVVTLLDGRTFEEIDACGAMASKPDFWNPGTSYMTDAPDLFTESFEALTPEQMQALEKRLKQMVGDGVHHCLRDLKLMP